MKLVSWNVNGLRAALGKGFTESVRSLRPAVICLQETKARPEQIDEGALPKGYQRFWCSAEKPGYSGVAVFTKETPLDVTYGMKVAKHDREGRVINLEFPDFILINVYTPNSQNELARLDYRVKEWDVAFRRHARRLAKEKPVVFCGDLNVAHKEIDLANPKSNTRNAGFTQEERDSFGKLLKAGFLDTFREFEPGGGHYSWWSFRSGARERNVGWRIDYFGLSPSLRPRLKDAFIRPDIMGSDHCPVGVTLS